METSVVLLLKQFGPLGLETCTSVAEIWFGSGILVLPFVCWQTLVCEIVCTSLTLAIAAAPHYQSVAPSLKPVPIWLPQLQVDGAARIGTVSKNLDVMASTCLRGKLQGFSFHNLTYWLFSTLPH